MDCGAREAMSLRLQYGDLLAIKDADVICHQVNCLTVKSHGLSNQISSKYSWGDIYQTRISINGRNLASLHTRGIPGTIKVFRKRNFPSIVCMLAQWDYGRCDQARKRNIPPYCDTTENREEWFRQCLDKIGLLDCQRIVFPFKIGCGHGGGNWRGYFKLLKSFSKKYNKDVKIIVPRGRGVNSYKKKCKHRWNFTLSR